MNDAQTTLGDRSERDFLDAGDAQLPGDDDIERRAQRVGHLASHDDAATRKGQHRDSRIERVSRERAGKFSPRGLAVAEDNVAPRVGRAAVWGGCSCVHEPVAMAACPDPAGRHRPRH